MSELPAVLEYYVRQLKDKTVPIHQRQSYFFLLDDIAKDLNSALKEFKVETHQQETKRKSK